MKVIKNKFLFVGFVLICLMMVLFFYSSLNQKQTSVFDDSDLSCQLYYIDCNKYIKSDKPKFSNYLFVVSIKDKNNKLSLNDLKKAKIELEKPAVFGKRQVVFEKDRETIDKILDQKIIKNKDDLYIYQSYEIADSIDINIPKYIVKVFLGEENKDYPVDVIIKLAK